MNLKISLTFLMLLSVVFVNAQELVGTSGGSFENATYSMDWSVGEVATSTYVTGSYTLSEGLHQNFITVDAIDDLPEFGISVYPNPTTSLVNITSNEISDYEVQITDVNGSRLTQQSSTGNQAQVDFSTYSNGIYFMSILKNNKIQTFKIIKK